MEKFRLFLLNALKLVYFYLSEQQDPRLLKEVGDLNSGNVHYFSATILIA